MDTPTSLSVYATFTASIRSVGTACTLASVGIYLHRRGFVIGDGKRTLALISQQVTIPLFLFSKIIYCNQDWSTDPCPDVTQSLKDVWILLFWPAYVVGVGFIIGTIVSKICSTPKRQVRAVLAACGFGNSTGLPITLLTVVHANFPSTSDLGRIDPCLFLSVYLLLYPVLQWGIGGWLLAPEDEDMIDNNETPTKETTSLLQKTQKDDDDEEEDDENGIMVTPITDVQITSTPDDGKGRRRSLVHNVLNNRSMRQWYQYSRRGMVETDASLYMSVQENLYALGGGGAAGASPAIDGPPPPITYHGGGGGTATGDGMIQQQYPNYGGVVDNNYYNTPTTPATITDETGGPTGEQLFGAMKTMSGNAIGLDIGDDDDNNNNNNNGNTNNIETTTAPIKAVPTLNKSGQPIVEGITTSNVYSGIQDSTYRKSRRLSSASSVITATIEDYQDETILKTIKEILGRCLQPPVVGAILGMIIASIPALRGLFVDLIDRSDDAPLEWLFDGLYSVGQAAVPINMIILGCNLSASHLYQQELAKKKKEEEQMLLDDDSINKDLLFDDDNEPSPLLSNKTMVGVVIGKMLIMPMIGFLSAIIFREYFWDIPDDIAGSFYLVIMIVFLTPTANNVMVMVELSGSGSKEGIAQVIAYQYMAAPLMLSLTMTAAVGMASHWS